MVLTVDVMMMVLIDWYGVGTASPPEAFTRFMLIMHLWLL